MTNIWGFLIQTVAVSLIAGLLLILKWILQDKLSARWQYGVWIIFVVRILWPMGVNETILIKINYWMELLKAEVEQVMTSAYTLIYEPVRLKHVLPVVENAPKSITDWLFLIYGVGVVLWLLWYMISYWRLRMLLRKGVPASKELQNQMDEVCEIYDLKPCRVVMVSGLSSAFVCGVLRPILAVPADQPVDDKVILHELLHLRYKDSLQSIGWCIFRAMHWCNPFLQMVFNRIGNDMETLCDQRVLERLEGEERRDYGMILLNMVNETYARVPGTTSISNGGANISHRIEAIVRFKKYPKGMELVSWCIILILGFSLFFQTETTYSADKFKPGTEITLKQSVVMARLNRCSTMAGALDTYAKGLILENGIYILTASPLDKHEELVEMMQNNNTNIVKQYHYESGEEFEYDFNFAELNSDIEYAIYNLVENEDEGYDAYLGFAVADYCPEDLDGNGHIIGNEDEISGERIVLVPVNVRYEDAWVVEEIGDKKVFINNEYDNAAGLFGYGSDYVTMFEGFPTIDRIVECEAGTVSVSNITIHCVEEAPESQESDGTVFIGEHFSMEANLDAEFRFGDIYTFGEYSCYGHKRDDEIYSIAIDMDVFDSDNEDVGSDSIVPFDSYDKEHCAKDRNRDGLTDESWDGHVRIGHGYNESYQLPAFLPDVKVRLFWNGEVVEELMVEGETYIW